MMKKNKKIAIAIMSACSLACFSVGGALLGGNFDVNPLKAQAATEIVESDLLEQGNTPENYAYSFMVVGDTQRITYKSPENLSKIYDYVVANVESKNVKHVFGLGDITEASAQAEWDVAKEQITKMDDVVPYSLIRGNHDTRDGFTTYFGTDSTYAQQYTYCYDNSTLNTIHTFSAGDYDYMVVALDFGPSDAVLEWAGDIIEAHPYHNVIVTTHGYLYRDGTTLDAYDYGAPTSYTNQDTYNNGDDMWDKFVSKYENISLVLCGHELVENITYRQDVGDNGNVVTQMMINPQVVDDAVDGCLGMVATFYVSEDGKTIDVEYYSTIQEKYFRAENQFTFTMSTVQRRPDFYADKSAEILVQNSTVDGQDHNGIRFAFTMTEEQFASLLPEGATVETATGFADGVEVGAMLLPASELGRGVTSFNAQMSDLLSNASVAKKALPFNKWQKTENGYTTYAYLYNLPVYAYLEEILACAYYTVDGNTVYSDISGCSLAEVAESAIESGGFGDSVITLLQQYLPITLEEQLYSIDDATIDVSAVVSGDILGLKDTYGAMISYTNDNGVLKVTGHDVLNGDGAQATGAVTKVKVYTTTATYILPLKVCTDVIDSSIEFAEMSKFITTSHVNSDYKMVYGYFILSQDIDFNDYYEANGTTYYNSPFSIDDMGNTTNSMLYSTFGWNATFDGNGHRILNLVLGSEGANDWSESLFGTITGNSLGDNTSGGLIKDVAFINASIRCDESNYLRGANFLAHYVYGNVNNVYLDLDLSHTGQSYGNSAIRVSSTSAVIDNLTVVIRNELSTGTNNTDVIVKEALAGAIGSLQNVVLIGGKQEAQIVSNYATIGAIQEANSTVKAYTSIANAATDTTLTKNGSVTFGVVDNVYTIYWNGKVVYEEEIVYELAEQLYSIDDATIDLSKVAGEISAITRDGVGVTYTLDDNGVATISNDTILNGAATTATGAITNLTIQTNVGKYILPLKVCTDVIDSSIEFAEMSKFITAAPSDSTKSIIQGYYILSQNIDFNDYYTANNKAYYFSPFVVEKMGASATGGYVYGWDATFDGNGYQIKNLTLSGRNSADEGFWTLSLFGMVTGANSTNGTNGGVIKNVAFVNAKMMSDNDHQMRNSSFLASYVYGKVENVYIDIDLTTELSYRASAIDVSAKWAVVHNLTVVVRNPISSGTNNTNYVVFARANGADALKSLNNAVLINNGAENQIVNTHATISDIQTANSTVKAYTSIANAAADTTLTKNGSVTFGLVDNVYTIYWNGSAVYTYTVS